MSIIYHLHTQFPLCYYKGFSLSIGEFKKKIQEIQKVSKESFLESDVDLQGMKFLLGTLKEIHKFVIVTKIDTSKLPNYRCLFFEKKLEKRKIEKEQLQKRMYESIYKERVQEDLSRVRLRKI